MRVRARGKVWGSYGECGGGDLRALLCRLLYLPSFARAVSVPWPSEAIAPMPSAEQGRRAPILVCRLPRAGSKLVSPVMFPFLASLTLPGSVQREIRGGGEIQKQGRSPVLGFEMS